MGHLEAQPDRAWAGPADVVTAEASSRGPNGRDGADWPTRNGNGWRPGYAASRQALGEEGGGEGGVEGGGKPAVAGCGATR